MNNEWISVEEETPEIGEYVLLSIENGWNTLMGKLLNDCWVALFKDGENKVEVNNVTHWMPLPSPPKP